MKHIRRWEFGLLGFVLCFMAIVIFSINPTKIVRAAASDSDNQTVSVTVNDINEIALGSTSVIIPAIETTTAGQAPDSQSITDTLDFTTNAPSNSTRKITVSLDGNFTDGLTVTAWLQLDGTVNSGTQHGTSTGNKTLSTVAQDLATGLYEEAVSGNTLTYTATATAETNPDTYSQVATYTIQAQ